MSAVVYQIFYASEQRKHLDSGFTPLDVTASNCPKWCEYRVFRDQYSSNLTAAIHLFGFVSWKFFMKTHLRSADLFAVLDSNPGADVYFVNPYETSIAGLYRNVWTQLDAVYPGVLPVAQRCATEAGYTFNMSRMVMPSRQMAFCNYWIATKPFWEEYLRFSKPMYDYLEQHLDADTEKFFVECDKKNHLGLFPHIMERMFSTFLHMQDGRWKVVQIPLPKSILEIDQDVIDACNRTKAKAVLGVLGLPALEMQDVLLTYMMKYKQAADRGPSSGLAITDATLGLIKRASDRIRSRLCSMCILCQ